MAYGRTYNAKLTLLEKKQVLEQWTHDRKEGINPKYRKLPETREFAIFKTENGDDVTVTPRYVGSELGSNDDGCGNTICTFFFNNEYVALALYNKNEKKIVVHEY